MSHQLYHEICVFLERKSADEAWGLRLAGGADLNSPLIVIRVTHLKKFFLVPLPRARERYHC